MRKSLFLVIIALFLISNVAFAETSHEKVEKDSSAIMVRLGLLKGYQGGDLGLEKKITRAEFATIIIRMLGYQAKPFNPKPKISFKDLSKKHWAYMPVRMAASLGYIKGYSDKKFKPSNNITYSEAITIMVRILGYDDKLEGKWPDNYLNKAKEIGITKNLDVVSKKAMTRGDIAVLVVDSMGVEMK